MESTLAIVVVALVVITALYHLLPHREASGKKPAFALFPKYKARIKHSLTNEQLEAKLAAFGFEKKAESGSVMNFSRGSVLGNFSIELAKVNVTLEILSKNEIEIRVNAGWVAGFDTGDHWQFTRELVEKLNDA